MNITVTTTPSRWSVDPRPCVWWTILFDGVIQTSGYEFIWNSDDMQKAIDRVKNTIRILAYTKT